MIWSGPSSYAKDELLCPPSIASIEGNHFSNGIIPILSQIYERIGCSLKLNPLPGRRGIHYFNTGKVDGEVVRFEIVEEKFERPFIRSEVPLLILTGSLWRHPDHLDSTESPVGYAIGALWQEEFAKTHNTKSFDTTIEVLQAYNSGAISSFVALDVSIVLMGEGELVPPPVRIETIHENAAYHYLAEEFTPFMNLLSEELKKSDPFMVLKNK